MDRFTGRREANKQATRVALRQAAERLFAEQGYEPTTVAQIAKAAQVGERTFYRYFDSKEDLLAERAFVWIDALQLGIRSRPAEETHYQAVARSMTAAVAELVPGSEGAWILGDGPHPLALLKSVQPRPRRRLERAIADAIMARADAASAGTGQPLGQPAAQFEAQLLARVAIAALRVAAAHLREHGETGGPGLERMLSEAFTRLTDLVR